MTVTLTDSHGAVLRAIPLRYIFFDIDGTLVNTRHQISPQTISALRALNDRGVGFGLASGRPFFGAASIIRTLDVKGVSVFYSGALVIEPASKRSLLTVPMEEEEINSVLSFARKEKFYVEAYTNENYFIEAPSPLGEIHAHYLGSPPQIGSFAELRKHHGILKLVIIATSPIEEKSLRAFARSATSLNFGIGYGASHGDIVFGNVTSRRATREQALEKALHHLNLGYENIAAFGDAEADIPFLEAAGLGIAMANAPDVVQQAARFVTKSVDEDGVAYALSLLD